MKQFLLLLITSLVSCGYYEGEPSRSGNYDRVCTVSNLVKETYAAPFQSILTKFSVDAQKRKVKCFPVQAILFSDKIEKDGKNTVLGYCDFSYVIFINRDTWFFYSEHNRMMIMYHELGHCALGLDHYDEKDDIMNTFLLSTRSGEEPKYKWNELVNNMFNRVRRK